MKLLGNEYFPQNAFQDSVSRYLFVRNIYIRYIVGKYNLIPDSDSKSKDKQQNVFLGNSYIM